MNFKLSKEEYPTVKDTPTMQHINDLLKEIAVLTAKLGKLEDRIETLEADDDSK